jgi:hypothetical protein
VTLKPLAIRALHWGVVPAAFVPSVALPGGWTTALWPAPVDHDACFEEAGFDDFADSTEDWDREFRTLAGALVRCGRRLGKPMIASGERPAPRHASRRHLPAPLSEDALIGALIAPTVSDNFPACEVRFGDGPSLVLRTSDGHPLFLIGVTPPDAWPELLAAIGAGRPVLETPLRWPALLR